MRAADGRDGPRYPVGLRLLGRRVVVVGGGEGAHRQVIGLLEAGARVSVVAPEVTPALEALTVSGATTWMRRRYEYGDLAGAWFAVSATDDPVVDEAVAEEADEAHIFCASVSAPTASTAWQPLVARLGALVVGVQDDSDSVHATVVRDAVVAGLADGSIAKRPRRPAGTGLGCVTLVGGGPGDPGLITVRGAQAVSQADVVIADHLAPQSLLASLPPEVEVIDASKLPRGRSMAQEQISALLVEHARAGRRVVRLKGGDPFVFGRGMEEIEGCVRAGVPVEVVPGVTSAIAVPALAGIPVTHRGMTHEFVVVSGHLAPGHPDSLVDWSAIARLRGTVVVLMGVANAAAIAASLVDHGRPPTTPVAIISDGSMTSQRVRRTTLAELPAMVAEEEIRPPAVWILGDVVALTPRHDPAGAAEQLQ